MDMDEIKHKGLRDNEKIKNCIFAILREIGEDPNREGLKRTPIRVAKSYEELFSGYSCAPEDVLDRSFNPEGYDELVMVTTDFVSTCEHHLLPFWGKAWVGYIPDKQITGLDKLVKLVNVCSRRLQNQERITKMIAEAMEKKLQPKGVMVVLRAKHGCVMFRETRSSNSETTTSCIKGVFRTKPEARSEFLQLMNGGK